MSCIATVRGTSCTRPAVGGTPFCRECGAAPATRRGGWLSAAKRKRDVSLDASSVAPRLWVGAAPPFDVDLPKIDMLVLCAREIQPTEIVFHGQVVRCPIPDGELTGFELQRAVATSANVADALIKRKRVLVTCAMGINRSALVASLALGRITRLTADQLIDLMRRRRRPECLYNEHFQGILQRFVGNGRMRLPPPAQVRAQR